MVIVIFILVVLAVFSSFITLRSVLVSALHELPTKYPFFAVLSGLLWAAVFVLHK